MFIRLRAWIYFEFQIFKQVVKPYLKLTMFVSFIIAWFITNGWSYILLVIGSPLLKKIAAGYIAILWLPFSIEKVFTVAIAIWIQKIFFNRKGKVKYRYLPTLYGGALR